MIDLNHFFFLGQERFQAVSKLYVRGAFGCVIVTDITNEASFNSINKWKEIVEQNCDYYDNRPIPIVLAQNKLDLLDNQDKKEFTRLEYAENFAKNNGLFRVIQTSAKNNQNLTNVFESLTEEILKRNMISDDPINFSEEKGTRKSIVKVNKEKEKNSKQNSACC